VERFAPRGALPVNVLLEVVDVSVEHGKPGYFD